MVVRKSTPARRKPGRPAAPAKKAAAPARKATAPKPTQKAAPKAAPAKAERRPISKAPANPKIAAHDVLRAALTADRAQAAADLAKAEFHRLHAVYWAEYGEVLDAAVEHSEQILSEMAPPPKNGRPKADGPARRALAKSTKVADEFFDMDTVKAMGAVEVRELAAELIEKGLITEPKIKSVIIDQMEEAGLFREEGDSDVDEDDEVDDEAAEDDDEEYDEEESEDDEDDSDGEDDGDDDEEAYTLADLKNMDIEELQGLAEQLGIRWKNLTKAALINKIMEQAEGDEEEPEDEEEDDETEELELDMDDIENMSASDLRDVLGKMGIDIPAKIKNKADALRELLLENIEEEEDDEE